MCIKLHFFIEFKIEKDAREPSHSPLRSRFPSLKSAELREPSTSSSKSKSRIEGNSKGIKTEGASSRSVPSEKPTPSISMKELERKVKINAIKMQEDRRLHIAGSAKLRLRARPSYLDLLEQRKQFRKCLVDLLHKEDTNTAEGRANLDRRYHYFVNRGLSMTACPLQKPWIVKILSLVPKRLRYVR